MTPDAPFSAGYRRVRGRLVLADGKSFAGRSFGAGEGTGGEVVFNTGMVGYPEALTDPSYRGQILVFTFPSLGNYGVPMDGGGDGLGMMFESDRIQVSGVICARYSEEFSHHQAVRSLENWLASSGIPALTGIDTRALTQHLRNHGTLLGRIEFGRSEPSAWVDPNRRNLVREVSCREPRVFGRGRIEIGLIDCGAKYQLIRDLLRHDCRVTVLPWNTPFPRVRGMAGVVLSNGPGNPRMARPSIEAVKKMMGAKIPILGICLGHQLLALAAGARTFKLKFGHRSHNQPCLDLRTGRCYATSQNHGFAVDPDRLPGDWEEWFRNANDGTNEGIRHRRLPFRSVQFHPEAHPGPGGTEWILEEFFAAIS